MDWRWPTNCRIPGTGWPRFCAMVAAACVCMEMAFVVDQIEKIILLLSTGCSK